MKKSILLLFSFFMLSGAVMAQYNYAIGLRSGGTTGLTLKRNYGSTAIEGIIGFWDSGVSLTGLWERNTEAFTTPGLNWYYGVGGHLAFYGNDFDGSGPSWYDNPHDGDDGAVGLGIDGIFGIEYKVREVPVAVSFGFKPYLEVVTDGDVLVNIDPGIGIKVAF